MSTKHIYNMGLIWRAPIIHSMDTALLFLPDLLALQWVGQGVWRAFVFYGIIGAP
jgi:hypothetical protein